MSSTPEQGKKLAFQPLISPGTHLRHEPAPATCDQRDIQCDTSTTTISAFATNQLALINANKIYQESNVNYPRSGSDSLFIHWYRDIHFMVLTVSCIHGVYRVYKVFDINSKFNGIL